MEKAGGLGAQRRPTKRRRRSRKGFARAVAEYLISDSYMYAPLIDLPPSDPSAAANVHGTSPGPLAENGEPVVQLQRLW